MSEKLTRHADASQEMVRPVVVRFYYPLWVSPTSSLGSWSTRCGLGHGISLQGGMGTTVPIVRLVAKRIIWIKMKLHIAGLSFI